MDELKSKVVKIIKLYKVETKDKNNFFIQNYNSLYAINTVIILT